MRLFRLCLCLARVWQSSQAKTKLSSWFFSCFGLPALSCRQTLEPVWLGHYWCTTNSVLLLLPLNLTLSAWCQCILLTFNFIDFSKIHDQKSLVTSSPFNAFSFFLFSWLFTWLWLIFWHDVSVLHLLQFQQSVTSELKGLGRSSYILCVDSPLIIRQALHPEASKKVMGQTVLPHFVYRTTMIARFSSVAKHYCHSADFWIMPSEFILSLQFSVI